MVRAGKRFTTPKPYPTECRCDVVAVARQGGPIARIPKEFGITESCLRNWLLRADIVDGKRPDAAAGRPADLVGIQYRASRPNELWVVDFSYVPAWERMGSPRTSRTSTRVVFLMVNNGTDAL